MTVKLYVRKQIVVNTDPQRRCYDGCHFSSETVWGDWELIGPYSIEDAMSSMKTFQEINPAREYRLEEAS